MNNGNAGSRPVFTQNINWDENAFVFVLGLGHHLTCDSRYFEIFHIIRDEIRDMSAQREANEMNILCAAILNSFDQLSYAFASMPCILRCTRVARGRCQFAPVNKK